VQAALQRRAEMAGRILALAWVPFVVEQATGACCTGTARHGWWTDRPMLRSSAMRRVKIMVGRLVGCDNSAGGGPMCYFICQMEELVKLVSWAAPQWLATMVASQVRLVVLWPVCARRYAVSDSRLVDRKDAVVTAVANDQKRYCFQLWTSA